MQPRVLFEKGMEAAQSEEVCRRCARLAYVFATCFSRFCSCSSQRPRHVVDFFLAQRFHVLFVFMRKLRPIYGAGVEEFLAEIVSSEHVVSVHSHDYGKKMFAQQFQI